MAIKSNVLNKEIVGSIKAFHGTVLPDGYLWCDGSSLEKALYPVLYAAIGDSAGSADANHFNVPDMRGKFMRGVDGSANQDLDKAARTAAQAGGNTGNNVGSVQGDAIRNITGSASQLQATDGSVGTGAITTTNYTSNGDAGESRNMANINLDASLVVPTGSDNRPKNVYVNFIIKY